MVDKSTEALANIMRELDSRRDDPALLEQLKKLPSLRTLVEAHRAEYEKLSDDAKIAKAKALILEYENGTNLTAAMLVSKDEDIVRDDDGKLIEIRFHLLSDAAEQIGFGSDHIIYSISTETPSKIVKEYYQGSRLVHADLLEGPLN